MRLPIRSCVLLSSLTVFLVGASAVRADYITGTLDNGPIDGGILNPGANVNINLGDGSAPSVAYYPGVVNWTVANGPNASWVGAVGSAFTTFCIELTQDINPGGTYTYNLVNLANAPKPGSPKGVGTNGMGATKATEIEDLWTLDYGSIAHSSNPNINAAAFQLAIWKIEYDWGDSNYDNFSAGNFQASGASSDGSSAVTLAAKWLKTLYNTNPTSVSAANLIALDSLSYQDQVMALPPTPTPVPPTFYLTAIGAATLALYGYRRRPGLGTIQK